MHNKKLGFEYPLPQITNVTRVGRKIFFTSDVNEDSIHELIKILSEIEAEDDELSPQFKVEKLINEVLDATSVQSKKINKKELDYIEQAINNYKNDSSLSKEPIFLYINSYGGNIYEALQFIDYIRDIMRTPVFTIATGKTMSAGTLMLIAGDKRFATQNATILIHQMSAGTIGFYQKMLEDIAEHKRLNDLVNEKYLAFTKIDEELLEEIFERKYDYYMTPEEALELGVIDEII